MTLKRPALTDWQPTLGTCPTCGDTLQGRFKLSGGKIEQLRCPNKCLGIDLRILEQAQRYKQKATDLTEQATLHPELFDADSDDYKDGDPTRKADQ